MSDKIYDTIIIGGGPAGLSAAIYARRSNLDTLLIEKTTLGGLIFNTAEIENYPGGIKGESGVEFSMRMAEHAESFGFEKLTGEATEVELEGKIKKVVVSDKKYFAKTVIVATGNTPVALNIPGESEYIGRGVSYCATCDGPFFRDRDIYVIGGGNSAVEEALHLAKFGKSITVVHRRNELRANRAIIEKAINVTNIKFMFDTVPLELKGEDLLRSIVVRNVQTGEIREIAADGGGVIGVFIFVGMRPQTKVFEQKIKMSEGFILADEEMHTNIPGVFAAGDVRKKTLRQVVTAVADGAVAAVEAEKYIDSNQFS
jgi:thioredoxin reductase (NADPH)